MQVVLATGDSEREVDVLFSGGETIGDLFAAGSGRHGAPDTIFVNGHATESDTLIVDAGIVAGSAISLEAGDIPAERGVELRILAGPAAGESIRLPPGRHVLGSGPGVTIALRAPGVKPRHLWLHVGHDLAVDVSAVPGAPLRRIDANSLMRVGACTIEIGAPREPRVPLRTIPGRRGTISFNRPPRLVAPQPVPTIPVPEEPRPPASRARMGIAALVVPVLFGLTLAVVIHPRMAMFALLGPVMMSAGWLDDKRRLREFKRTSAEEMAIAAEKLGAVLDIARTAEALRRRRAHPSIVAVAAIATGEPAMWQRRPLHTDFMHLALGYGPVRWLPPLDRDPATAADCVRETVRSRGRLPTSPLPFRLDAGQVLGVAGHRPTAISVARSLLCQAAALHGPSDLQIAVVTDHPGEWDWVKWLPHTVADGGSGRRLIAVTAEERAQLVVALSPSSTASGPDQPGLGNGAVGDDQTLTLLVVDVEALASPEAAGLRHLLGGRGGQIAGVVLAPLRGELPSICTAVADVSAIGLRCTGSEDDIVVLAPVGAPEPLARSIARALSRFDDPDRREAGAELPAAVRLIDLLGVQPLSPDSIAARWRRTHHNGATSAPIGVTEAGLLQIDLVGDGPHALLAGTTGSGKSELLRTLVASLAVTVDPEHLSFVLIDYKGGSAFDACAGLPHTVGMVTDLDDRLAERALGCLEAELRYRERRLRDAGADDLQAFLATGDQEPLPRMLIVIDEFAALAKELPDFMDALVDIAARGRSLGVHLLLATQRPAGVIRDNVRANTNLRLALRVQDRADSVDVLGDPGAASIARSQPGRGFARLGPGELVPFQAALVTGTSADGQVAGLPMRPFRFAMHQDDIQVASLHSEHGQDGPTDLEVLVSSVLAAAHQTGMRTPRRPWPDPLPSAITRSELDTSAPPSRLAVPIGLVDEPEHQRRGTLWWSPDDGSLAVFGLIGAGATTTIATLACGLAKATDPEEVHVYVLDFDAGGTAPLAALPHVGAVVGAAERERQIRLIRHLVAEIDSRKAAGAGGGAVGANAGRARIVLFVDNFGGFAAAFDAAQDTWVKDMLYRIITEGPAVGVAAVVTGTRQNAVPLAVLGTIPHKLVLRLADPLAAAALGLRRIPADMPDGRAIHVATKADVQIALPHADGISAAVAEIETTALRLARGPSAIEELPLEVKSAAIEHALTIADEDWFVPVGIGDSRLKTVGFPLAAGDHVLIAGEPRTGRTTILCAIADMIASKDLDVTITAVATRRSALRDVPGVTRLVTTDAEMTDTLTTLLDADGRHLILVDDADAVDDPGVLKLLASSRRPGLHVIAAGRRDLKTVYNHWAKDLCRSRIGLWLRPSPGLDGDLWSTPLPRYVPVGMPPGRGYLIGEGAVELVQTARP